MPTGSAVITGHGPRSSTVTILLFSVDVGSWCCTWSEARVRTIVNIVIVCVTVPTRRSSCRKRNITMRHVLSVLLASCVLCTCGATQSKGVVSLDSLTFDKVKCRGFRGLEKISSSQLPVREDLGGSTDCTTLRYRLVSRFYLPVDHFFSSLRFFPNSKCH